MQTPGNLPLAGDRWTPFVRTWQLEGVDLTDATFSMQLRLYPDAPGDALVDLATVTTSSAQGVRLIYGGTDTVANHIAASRIDEAPEGMAGSDSLALTLLGVRINETTMEALPAAAEGGDDAPLYWDIHITPDGGIKQRWLYGTFTVRAGVTH